jgi:hypothetical protein
MICNDGTRYVVVFRQVTVNFFSLIVLIIQVLRLVSIFRAHSYISLLASPLTVFSTAYFYFYIFSVYLSCPIS